jgi:hypothetical protein
LAGTDELKPDELKPDELKPDELKPDELAAAVAGFLRRRAAGQCCCAPLSAFLGMILP